MSWKQCEQFEAMLVDYVDGELGTEEAKLIHDHLEQCLHCRDKVDALEKSLDLAQIIWRDNLTKSEQQATVSFQKKKRAKSWRYIAAAAVILFATAITLHNHFSVGRKSEQLTIEQIEQEIMAEASAARILAAGDLLARKPNAESLAKAQYKYILDYYPDTEAASQARAKMQ